MRFRVEHALGRLKCKFRTLQNRLMLNLEHAPVIIDACAILYNFILVHEGEHSANVFYDADQTGLGLAGGCIPRTTVRQVLVRMVAPNQPSRR